MIRFLTIVLTGLLFLPLAPLPAAAKTISAAPQIHVVKAGDTLYEISRASGLTVAELKQLNGLNSTRLKVGQKLALTRAAAPPLPRSKNGVKKGVAPSAPADTKREFYTVKTGDSLHTIARRYNLTVDQLKKFNSLSSSRLKPGQRLTISNTGRTSPASTTSPRKLSADVHVVKNGETLYTIARRHAMAVDDLKRINDLSGNRLRIGQRLSLASPEPEPSPLLLAGDADEDEVMELAYTASSELEQVAFNYLSTPYRFGGTTRKGIDCSAFVQQVFREVDVDLPRSAREQFRVGEDVNREALQPGDLLFFRTYAKYPSHVGIYLGDGKMIHASSRSHRVVVTDIDYPYYRKRFIGAKRITLLDEDQSLIAHELPPEEPLADGIVEAATLVNDISVPQPVPPPPVVSANPSAEAEPPLSTPAN